MQVLAICFRRILDIQILLSFSHAIFYCFINAQEKLTLKYWQIGRRREDLNLRDPLGVNLISSEAH